MSYVDLIIKYLSGDLSTDEASSFEKDLASNDELKQEFEKVSAAYALIRDRLQNRDQEAFRKKLDEAMKYDIPHALPVNRRFRPSWLIPLVAACSLAILYILTIKPAGDEKVLSRFYDPQNDPVVLAFNHDTRGEVDPGILRYREGNYRRSMELLEERINREKENKMYQLYYLLSAIEMDHQEEAIELLSIADTDTLNLPDQALSWYMAMALLKSHDREAALEWIHPLTRAQGPYQTEAVKLEKVLLK